ncbi:MAG: CDP-alcohol phosphatidyltransferase family protein [Campylobacterota bacterium]
MKIKMTIPNILSLSRIAMAPFLLVASYYGSEMLFFTFFSLMLISDVLDGYIARKLHQCSKIGSKLDSIGDYVTYISVPFATWWLWPEIIHEEALYIGVAFTLFLVPGILGRIKFGQMVAYHTWITKVTAVTMSAGLIILLFTKYNLAFHIAVYLLILEAVESMIITFVLDRPRANVKSLWHVLKSQ